VRGHVTGTTPHQWFPGQSYAGGCCHVTVVLQPGYAYLQSATVVQEAIDQLRNDESSLEDSLEDLHSQKKEIAEKLNRKKTECERMEQRLLQLKSVKAPYQDELDTLEEELSGLYSVYLNKFRSLEYLEAELQKVRRCAKMHGHAQPPGCC
jgi:predicted nuclease with TOPRIM domain